MRSIACSLCVCLTGVLEGDKIATGRLEADGFPAIGTYLQEGDPLYRYIIILYNIALYYNYVLQWDIIITVVHGPKRSI